MTIPEALLQSLQDVPGFDQSSFVAAHEQAAQISSVRFNPAKQWRTASPPAGSEEDYQPAAFSAFTALPVAGRVPWSSCGYY
ncbi:MAG TPA: hypothetical protein VL307_00920, partial [Chitinophagaceae bacterium]|nr:hypothetical protein [Chitinophagaceae bacterium]